ncbi:hypothetical protein FEK33_12440 [Nocardia asteroides NBRC 15531]|uniref:PE domain-containing protein n=1 Tax=Nocardia asteroides NBRC 15531 TaxID=1110697 RepID=U5EFU9_NOCAS|nr:hypothetical protein [Nocardia asteroides]TLF66833.1 hypothetical protein FEK33_12440 [Nocardia asteroides NBRC 15531]UGT51922.1 hypothetical protein LT345_15765 [Nocardia asteroides]SFN02288.1 hypothetical protein SAMN05444423_105391 [Nocardia asteroides]VEG35163.1 Uncharacterised protein [Nocardia asteroides]GAD85288.1 hypothetical protein NCAST_30_00580 [Nocardia asteroides NBRC 15531]
MTDPLDQQIREWQTAEQQAADGELRMDEGIGEALRAACEAYRDRLVQLQHDALGLQTLSGYGGIPSAQILRAKFQNKAVHGDSDDSTDSAFTRLGQHIEIATLMRDTYAATIGKVGTVDQQNAAELGAKGGQL